MLKTSLIQLTEAFPLSADVDSNIKVGSGGGGDKTVKKSLPHIKAIIKATSYLTPNANIIFT